MNQRLPSGPGAIPRGEPSAEGIGNSVMTPSVVIRPIRLPCISVNHRLPSGPAATLKATVGSGNRKLRDDLAAGEPGQARHQENQDQRGGASSEPGGFSMTGYALETPLALSLRPVE